ncbi:eukaryotic translation initiation factor 4 gamma 3-like [Scomber scombrus]|uniref:Eukaryotic translation initiation factor 4 gamma 3-like n=1 Tax=Scomber scombrus TaxID=13677 RepID=A0AAV1NSG3_SCOSC
MKAQKLPYNPVLGYKRFSSGKQCCNEEAENAWKPGMERQPSPEDTEVQKTQELFRRIRSILNKITPQTFRQLMKQITELAIDTEERLKGVIDLVFEKAIKEPSFSVVYANMCRCLMGLKVPLTDKRGTSVNFRKLLLNRCQKGFEEKYERNQNKLDSAALSTEHEQLPAELEEAMDEAQRRSIGNIKFIGELFNLKMLTEAILHDCVVKLLNNKDEESLECLCTLLTTIGKGLDHEKAKPRIDQYFNQMTKIIEERKTSSKIRSMLQDVIDLRLHNWVSTRAEQGPKTIKQIHEEAKIAEQGKQRKVHHQHLSKNSKRRPVKPRPMATNRPAFSEEEIERSCKSIVKEFLHINDYKEVVQCVNDLDLGSQLHIFVRVGVELTLEHSQITRNHMGQLLFQLVQHGILPKPQFHKGFADMLKQVDDMVIDIPHIWLYLAELLCPVLKEGGFSMRELFSELSKPLLPMGRAGIFISEVLHILCKQTSHRTVVGLWKESGLNWTDFLPEGEDVQAFISQQKLQFILSEDSNPDTAPSKRILSPEELSRQLERLLLKDMASNTQIFDWVEGNLDESQMSSASFQRALMTAVGEEAVKDTNCRVDMAIIQKRKPVLISYLKSDTERQLQALYALQALMVDLNNPPNLLRMFFDCLYDEDIILEDTFFKWERSKDPAEQRECQILYGATKLKVKLMHLKTKQGSFEKEKVKCDKMAGHITLQAQQTEKGIKEEFQKLYQFLRAEETARIDAVRKEATLKSEAMKIRIVNLTAEISSLSDKIKTMEGEIKAEDNPFMLNVKSSIERSQCNLPKPETPSGALIDEAKHLGNLMFTVWRKMKDIIQYTPVTFNPNTSGNGLTLSENLTRSTSRMKAQKLPDNPERKSDSTVIGYESFSSGKHSWDVEVDREYWAVGVTARNKHQNSEKVWGISLYGGQEFHDLHSKKIHFLSEISYTKKIRVQLDYDHGILHFFNLHNSMKTPLHTIRYTFKEPVFPYFMGCEKVLPAELSVKIRQPK